LTLAAKAGTPCRNVVREEIPSAAARKLHYPVSNAQSLHDQISGRKGCYRPRSVNRCRQGKSYFLERHLDRHGDLSCWATHRQVAPDCEVPSRGVAPTLTFMSATCASSRSSAAARQASGCVDAYIEADVCATCNYTRPLGGAFSAFFVCWLENRRYCEDSCWVDGPPLENAFRMNKKGLGYGG
jgi:hypothetical protein